MEYVLMKQQIQSISTR